MKDNEVTLFFLEQEISIIHASVEKKQLLYNLSQFYQHDMASFENSIKNLPNENGLYDSLPYFDKYWEDKNRHPFLIFYREEPIGFVLVNNIGTESLVNWNMAEFFIISRCRRKGIGRYVAQKIIQQFPGVWEIAVIPENKSAYLFWKSVIEKISPNQNTCVESKIIQVPTPHQMNVFRID
ncbi:MAG: hypothetical protein K940chlam8_00325 [Chlamydiae bacterium]|nr:hypothetical protein [Chlamydiota bacterium]